MAPGREQIEGERHGGEQVCRHPFLVDQRADLAIGSLAPGGMGDLRCEEISACFTCRLSDAATEFAAFAVRADVAADREGPVFAPQRLEQTRGGPEPRVERLVDAMFLEDRGRDVIPGDIVFARTGATTGKSFLVRQAVNAFKRHLPSAAPVNLVTEKDGQGRVYVSTYPTMMNLIDDTAEGKRRFGVGLERQLVNRLSEFRGHASRSNGHEANSVESRGNLGVCDPTNRIFADRLGGEVLKIGVGRSATPKDEVDRDTYRLFELQRGVPTDAYGLDEAVKDGYLVPPRAVSVPVRFIRQGLRYDDLSEDERNSGTRSSGMKTVMCRDRSIRPRLTNGCSTPTPSTRCSST